MWTQADGHGPSCACDFKTSPWQAIRLYRLAGTQLKQEGGLPDSIAALADGTTGYEAEIRTAWDAYKLDPTPKKAEEFIDYLVMISGVMWPEVMAAVLGIAADELTVDQQQVLQDALDEHHAYMRESLLPDITRYQQLGKLDSLDYRTIVLYAGALWQFGNLATVMFDGTKLRDLADLFMFAGPNDSETCTGERGCQSHANRVYTVAQILTEEIIPGRMRCLTNCRHFLLPLASPLKGVKHLPGRHDQKAHSPYKNLPASVGQLDTYLKGHDVVQPSGSWDSPGYVLNPRDQAELVENYLPTPGGSAGYELVSGFYDTKTGALVFGLEATNHPSLAGSVVGEYSKTTVGMVQGLEDRSVHIVATVRGDSITKVDFGVGRAGVAWRAGDLPLDEEKAFDNVYRAMDKLSDWGMADDTEVNIQSQYMDNVNTTLKHQMGRHDQRRHTPRAYRSAGTRLTPAYFTEGKGKYLLDYDMSPDQQERIIDAMLKMGVTEEDIAGLNEITTAAAHGYSYDGYEMQDWDGAGVWGFYSHGHSSVHVSLELFQDKQLVQDESLQKVLLHEIGHHKSLYSPPGDLPSYKRLSQASALTRVLYQEVGDTDYHHQLPTAGLRQYSLTNEREFLADTYKVMRTGNYSQRDELTRLWRQAGFIEQDETLENVFKGEMIQVDEIVSYEPGDETIAVVTRPVVVDVEVVTQTPWYYVGVPQARLKHQMGRHDQRTHTPEAYRGQGAVPEKPGPKPYVPERVRELMDPDSETNTQAAKDWNDLSHADRMKLADPDAMDRGMAENLRRYREEVEIPHDLKGQKLTTKTYDQVVANTQARIDSLKGALTPVTEAQLREYTDTHMRKAVEQGLKDKTLKMDAGQLDDMMAKNIDKLAHQEIEARKRQLGDHGIRHVVGNIRAVDAMLDDPDLPATTGLQRMMALQTMVDHDMGYTVGVVAKSIPATEYHPLYSEKYAKAQGYDKVFGAGNAKEMTRMVREHDGTDLDWEKDTLMSVVRTADNTALFNREKLPALFYDVPGATDELYRLQLAQVGGTAKEATPKVQENLRKLVEDSGIDDRHKAELLMAVDEVSPYTGKFSLGMAAGEIEGYDYANGVMGIKVVGKPERELLNGLFDLGDRQFDKFAEAYDTTGNPSVGGLDFSKGGKKVLHIDYEEPHRKATGTLATMYDDSVRPDIRQASRQAGPVSTLTDRERAWPMIQANVKGKLTAGEMAEFERRFKAGTLDDMPLTERERSYLTKLKEMLKHQMGRHDQRTHAPKGSATRALADERVERKRGGREQWERQQAERAAEMERLRGGYKWWEIYDDKGPAEWLEEHRSEVELTDPEKDALSRYSGHGNERVNEYLRGKPGWDEFASPSLVDDPKYRKKYGYQANPEEVVSDAKNLTKLADKGRTKEPVMAWRGMKNDKLARAIDRGEDLTGATVTDKGLASTSLSSQVGEWSGRNWTGILGVEVMEDSIEWELKVPAGTKAIFKPSRREPEMILAPGSKFRVTGYEIKPEDPKSSKPYVRRIIYAEVEQ